MIGNTVTLNTTQECETDIDCLNNAPCKEVNAECINYKCNYSGECSKPIGIWLLVGVSIALLGTLGFIFRKKMFS